MKINDLLTQSELNLILNALQFYKEKQEIEEHNRHNQGWNTEKQQHLVQRLDDIEEKLFELIN